ncbi:MAG: XRE family transcriptional regulator [Bacillota bacterium]|nr:MAG: XRE family transcriptional regulator [Bacillota bacterium]
METFGEILKLLRNSMQLSRRQLSERLYISPETLRLLETGEKEPNLSLFIAIADYFDESLDYLAGREK